MDVILPDLIHILLGSMRFSTMTRMLLYYGLSWFNLMWTWLWYVMSREMMTYCFQVCLWGSLEKTSLPIGGLRNGYDFPHSVYPWSYQPWAQIIKKVTKGKFTPCIVVFLVFRNLDQTWLNYISSCLVLNGILTDFLIFITTWVNPLKNFFLKSLFLFHRLINSVSIENSDSYISL